MTSSTPDPSVPIGLEVVQAGQEFAPTPLDLSPAAVGALLESLDAQLPQDENGMDIVPPSVIASLSLGVLLRHVSLPPAALHASQEIQVQQPIAVGTPAWCAAVVANVSHRAGMTLVSLDFSVQGRPNGSDSEQQLASGSGMVMFAAENA